MPWILICLGSEYIRVHNIIKKNLVLQQALMIFEMDLFLIDIPFKTKINQILF